MEILNSYHAVKLKKWQFLHTVKNSACRVLTGDLSSEVLHLVKGRLHAVNRRLHNVKLKILPGGVKPMTKQRAIYLKCLDCAAGDSKEILFCTIFECPLWQYRCGYHISSKRYQSRIERAFQAFTQIAAELQREGLDMADFLPLRPQACVSAGKRGGKVKDTGDEAVQGKGVS